MTNILVIQLCRLGDILQTTPMLRGLRQAHPSAHITLMVLDGFSNAPVPDHLYDRLSVFPFEPVGRYAREERGGWTRALPLVRDFVRSLGDQPFDLVLNLTGTPMANALSAVVPSREVRGGLLAADRSRVVRHPWMTYFWASLHARSLGCINLVDLFRRVAHVPLDDGSLEIAVPSTASAEVESWLQAQGWRGSPLIALQLGASEERKRWTPEQFADMANLLPESAGDLVFVGAEAERPLIDRACARLQRPALQAAGRTSIVQLAALLARCRLLITNDTGTMHVATAMRTPVLDLSTGPVFVHETGPYAVGALAVEPVSPCFPCAAGAVCHHMSCRDDLVAGDVADVAMFAMGARPLPRPARMRVLQAARTPSGRLEYRPIWDPVGGIREPLRRSLARMWEASLPSALAPGQSVDRFSADLTSDASGRDPLCDFADQAETAAALARRLTAAPPDAVVRAGTDLAAHLEKALTRAALHEPLLPIVAYLRTSLDALTDRSVPVLARAYHREWKAAAGRARHLSSLLERVERC